MTDQKYTCIKCETELKVLYPESHNALKPESQMYLGGSVDKFTCGYGSKFDMDSFIIAICDDCLSKCEKYPKRKLNDQMKTQTKEIKVDGVKYHVPLTGFGGFICIKCFSPLKIVNNKTLPHECINT